MTCLRWFCLFAVLVAPQVASAAVNVQLNLRYTNPCDETDGGTWELLAGSDGGGIAGLTVLIDNINDDADAAGGSGFEVFETQQVGTVTEIVVGSDLESPLDLNVGLGPGTPGNLPDDLFPGNSPAVWANNALLATGTFGEQRPSFLTTFDTFSSEVNEFVGSDAVQTTFGATSVRGDGVGVDGLIPGDANRDGLININDYSLLSSNFDTAPTTWDQGNFHPCAALGEIPPPIILNGTDIFDFSRMSSNFFASSIPPALRGSLIPEPTALALLWLSLFGAAMSNRQRSRV